MACAYIDKRFNVRISLVARKPRLARCEERIANGLKAFWEIGEALMEIRDEKLYHETHETSEDYCKQRWSLGRAHEQKG